MDPLTPPIAQPEPTKTVKPGWKTTEFWLTGIATVASLVLPGVQGPWKLIPIVAYTISRGLAKN